MKILTIGDIHGRTVWKNAPIEAFDKVVFVGDYVDSFDKSNNEIYDNLSEILNKKSENPGKIELLLGNHDVQYMYFPENRCSGFRPEAQFDLTELFLKNHSHFKVAYQHNNFLFTHAGLSQGWYSEYKSFFTDNNIAGALNDMLHTREGRKALFQCGKLRGGTHDFGGILWADRHETEHDFLLGYHQIVGHTRQKEIKSIQFEGTDSSITYVDVLENSDKFYEINI
jgi:predicted phosphodiesterase